MEHGSEAAGNSRFGSPFSVPGLADEVPPGGDKIVVEDELLHGFSFEVWRRTATHLTGPPGGTSRDARHRRARS